MCLTYCRHFLQTLLALVDIMVSMLLSCIVCVVAALAQGSRMQVPNTLAGVHPLLQVRGGSSTNSRSDAELKKGIAKFYDESSGIWLDVWGEDMHHGYYPTPDFKDHKAAQVGMIDRSLEWAYGGGAGDRQHDQGVLRRTLSKMKAFIDVGCGVGGSSRHIQREYAPRSAKGVGISLSPYQVARAQQLTASANLTANLEYRVADALNMPFRDKSFDLVWSMESGEHMPDKKRFMGELFRVTAPGGRILVVTWCHRELRNGEAGLSAGELDLLRKINKAYYLPDWVPGSTYVRLAGELGLQDVRTTDWSEHVAPFWPAVMRSAFLRPRSLVRMLFNPSVRQGAVASWWMLRGFQRGLVRFVLVTGTRKA